MTHATQTNIHIFTTPKELRQIADQMERVMPTCKIGDDCGVWHVKYGAHTIIFVSDQAEYNKFVYEVENQKWL